MLQLATVHPEMWGRGIWCKHHEDLDPLDWRFCECLEGHFLASLWVPQNQMAIVQALQSLGMWWDGSSESMILGL